MLARAQAERLSEGKGFALWERRTRVLVARTRLPDAALRLTLTRGATGDGLVPARRGRPTLLLAARPLPPDLARRQSHGVSAILLPFPRDAGPPWGNLKLVGHASAVAGRLAAVRRGADEGLYVTPAGEVTEGTTTNVFLVERGALVTPPCVAGILPGVTRASRSARWRARARTPTCPTSSTRRRAPTAGRSTRSRRRSASGGSCPSDPRRRASWRELGGAERGMVGEVLR